MSGRLRPGRENNRKINTSWQREQQEEHYGLSTVIDALLQGEGSSAN
jgi:hypothetical protein